MRFVRTHEWDQHSPFSDALVRCVKCCEGNNVSSDLEGKVIERYMLRWRMEHDRFAAQQEQLPRAEDQS